MDSSSLLAKYEKLYLSLKVIIKKSEKRVIEDNPDELFIENINFFIKSYLINICTYLEAYLQDIAFEYARELNEKIKKAKVPHNFILWQLNGDGVKKKDLKYLDFNLFLNKKKISENLSANPYKTVKLFQYLGIDLNSDSVFKNNKDLINSIVTKRNNIIHYNDEAIDVSFSDLTAYIDVFIQYMKAVAKNL